MNHPDFNPHNRPVYPLHYTDDMRGMRFWWWSMPKKRWLAIWILGHNGEALIFELWTTGEQKEVRACGSSEVYLAVCPFLLSTPGPGTQDAIFALNGREEDNTKTFPSP